MAGADAPDGGSVPAELLTGSGQKMAGEEIFSPAILLISVANKSHRAFTVADAALGFAEAVTVVTIYPKYPPQFFGHLFPFVPCSEQK